METDPRASAATRPRLTAAQRQHLIDLADVRDNGNTGEAYFYPVGSQHRTAHVLARRGYLRNASPGGNTVYVLTDAGYEEARRLG